MPTRYTTIPTAEDSERMALPVPRTEYLDSHRVLQQSKEYGDIITFLKKGVLPLKEKGLGASQIKNIRRKAYNYSLTEQSLLKKERNGALAKCILRQEVPAVLKEMHDGCGHFANAITLDRIVGNFFWPTRTRDVEFYCRSCETCQRLGPRRKSTGLLPIIKFEPIAILELDYLEPINLSCRVTQAKYFIIVVDYFSRYT